MHVSIQRVRTHTHKQAPPPPDKCGRHVGNRGSSNRGRIKTVTRRRRPAIGHTHNIYTHTNTDYIRMLRAYRFLTRSRF